jgi:hypothetical protein
MPDRIRASCPDGAKDVPSRLDRALRSDLTAALRSRVIVAFLVLELAAAAVFVARRGTDAGLAVIVVWLGMLVVAFLAWWAGRHPRARQQRAPQRAAEGRLLMALLGAAGFAIWSFGIWPAAGFVLVISAIAGWLGVALLGARAAGPAPGEGRGRWARIPRPSLEFRPSVPLILLVAGPSLLLGGIGHLGATALALPSGLGQQVLYLAGLFGPLEAVLRRTDVAAVVAALVFALLHVPFNLPPAGGDIVAAAANAVFYQASAGMLFCLAYVRHRAVVPIGLIHALIIA